MDFYIFNIPGHERRNVVAICIEDKCLAVGGRDECLAILEEDHKSTEDSDPGNYGSTAAA